MGFGSGVGRFGFGPPMRKGSQESGTDRNSQTQKKGGVKKSSTKGFNPFSQEVPAKNGNKQKEKDKDAGAGGLSSSSSSSSSSAVQIAAPAASQAEQIPTHQEPASTKAKKPAAPAVKRGSAQSMKVEKSMKKAT